MPQIVGLSGSLRKGSFNAMLLRAAGALAPAGTRVQEEGIHGIPLYDGDVEVAGIPATVQALKDKVAAADGLLLVTPEYNNSLPGPMKNAIDWLSRPSADIARVFRGRPVAVMGATPGPGGTGMAQAAWLPVLRTLGTVPWFGARLQIASAGNVFDAEGGIKDEKIKAQVTAFMVGFSAFVAQLRGAGAAREGGEKK